MALTLANYRSRTQRRVNAPTTNDTILTETVLTEIVNDALWRISTERDWPWLYATATFSTAAGTATYALPTGHLRTTSLIVGEIPLPKLSIEDIGDASKQATTGWAVRGTNLVLYPTPTTVETVTHEYVRHEPALSGANDTPLIPDVYAPLVTEYCAHLAYQTRQDEQRSAAALSRYVQLLKGAMNDETKKRRGRVKVSVDEAMWG